MSMGQSAPAVIRMRMSNPLDRRLVKREVFRMYDNEGMKIISRSVILYLYEIELIK